MDGSTTDDAPGFPRLLASLRTAAGLTQEELAERAEITPRALSGMERGQVRRPQRGTVQRLVAALGLTGVQAERFVAVARGHRPGSGVDRTPDGSGEPPTAPSRPAVGPRPDRLPPPAQLPSDVRPFRGRSTQLAVLDRLLDQTVAERSGPGVCLLTGPTGVGKTALAVHWSHRVTDQFPDGQLYLDLRGHGRQHPVDPADGLAVLLRSLGLDDVLMASGVAERSGQLRSLLARRQVLILLDDARSIDQVRPLLPGSGQSLCLITSQDRLPGLVARDGGTALPLDLLDLDEATTLLADLIPEEHSPAPTPETHHAVLRRLAERCARLPLALRIAAERVVTHPELTLADHAAQLEQSGPLDALHTGGDDRTAIRTVLSWSVDRLEPSVRDAFELLGAHPGREWDTPAAAVLVRRSREATAQTLDDLARAHLVQRVGRDRWRQHDLLRAFAAERAAGDPARRRAAVETLSEHYLAGAGDALDLLLPGERDLRPTPRRPATVPGPPRTSAEPDDAALAEARDWLAREQGNVVTLIRATHEDGLHEQALRLAVMWRRPLELSGAFGDGIEAFRLAHASATALGDRAGEADCLRALASLSYLRDEHTSSISLFGRSLGLARELDDPARVCRALSGLGLAETRTGSYEDAAVHLEEALAISEAAGDLTGALTVTVNLAFLDYRRGRLDGARSWAERALHGFHETNSLHGEMHARQLLGDVRLAAADPLGALDDFRRAWWCAEQLGDRSMLAKALIGTERALIELGDAASPDDLRTQVRELLGELGLADEAARELVAAR